MNVMSPMTSFATSKGTSSMIMMWQVFFQEVLMSQTTRRVETANIYTQAVHQDP